MFKATIYYVDEEDKTVNESFSVNGTMAILINESGLYSLIISSKMPNANGTTILI
ncbi:BRO family protein [Listeria monocytogenes]|uniref:BRO family protein n=1 Tax=Listeria monocytogenes TaxID=1639 RepID=UPI001F552870|nr:Bro-N domain-containing protein [Listeria monocytogenes]